VIIMAVQTQHTVAKWHIVFCTLVAIVLMALGAVDLFKNVNLYLSESVAVARVVESRKIPNRRGGVSFEVRYVFVPAPGFPEFERCDFLGRTNLWSSLSEPDWQAAIAAKQVKVRFDPVDPGNNAPDASLPSCLGDSSAILLLGFGFGVAAVYGEVVRRRQMSKTT
jgi:hypothetical protein